MITPSFLGEAPAAAGDKNILLEKGAEVYDQSHCYACHGNYGFGTLGPRLSGDRLLADKTYVVTQILMGRMEMPAFAHKLSNDQIAAVATYVRNSWGNAFGEVSPADVENVRQTLKQASQQTAAPPLNPKYPQRADDANWAMAVSLQLRTTIRKAGLSLPPFGPEIANRLKNTLAAVGACAFTSPSVCFASD
jgi:mono/diheme cytochrome c family protein